jgi:hypothetical protein
MEKGVIAGDDYWAEVLKRKDEFTYTEIITLAAEFIMKIVKAFVSLHAGRTTTKF